jgi:hypothetical protein
MKNQLLPVLAIGSVAFALVVALPSSSSGQAAAEAAVPAALLAEIAAQQAAIEGNQTKIEDKIAKISEDIRQARIFVARGGGGVKK